LKKSDEVNFKAPLIVLTPTYKIIDELKTDGDWGILEKCAEFQFDDKKPKKPADLGTKIYYILKHWVTIFAWATKKRLKKETVFWLHQLAFLKVEW